MLVSTPALHWVMRCLARQRHGSNSAFSCWMASWRCCALDEGEEAILDRTTFQPSCRRQALLSRDATQGGGSARKVGAPPGWH